ncbi:hypothetical protein Nepgr_000161 [Nepenthes gracilis]|uniref:Uncharacterized protein n=1 Tax=Nepenthes gracilis TaxID=150966 RepID=A0AAD3RVB7_NEPGR|nr:hypothetical protein Nepgr_000161 [Nepenthes gracilis]
MRFFWGAAAVNLTFHHLNRLCLMQGLGYMQMIFPGASNAGSPGHRFMGLGVIESNMHHIVSSIGVAISCYNTVYPQFSASYSSMYWF